MAAGSVIGESVRTAIVNSFLKSDFAKVSAGAEIGFKAGGGAGAALGTALGGPLGGMIGKVGGEIIGGVIGRAIGESMLTDAEKELHDINKKEVHLRTELNLRMKEMGITMKGLTFVISNFKDIVMETLTSMSAAVGTLGATGTVNQYDPFGFEDQFAGIDTDFSGMFGNMLKLSDNKASTDVGGDIGPMAAMGGGAIAGAAIGSVIPVIGTAIGALVGAIGGGIVGLLMAENNDPVMEAAGRNAEDLFDQISEGVTDPFADFKDQIISTTSDFGDFAKSLREGIETIEIFSNVGQSMSSITDSEGRNVSVQGRGINIGNIRAKLQEGLEAVNAQQEAVLGAAQAEYDARLSIMGDKGAVIKQRMRELEDDDETGSEEYGSLVNQLNDLSGEMLDLEGIMADATQQAAEMGIEYEQVMRDQAQAVADSLTQIDNMRMASLNLRDSLIYASEAMNFNTGIDSMQTLFGMFSPENARSLADNFFSDFSDEAGAAGIGGGLFNTTQADVLAMFEDVDSMGQDYANVMNQSLGNQVSNNDIIEATGPAVKNMFGQTLALSPGQLQAMFGIDPTSQLGQEMAADTAPAFYKRMEDALGAEMQKFVADRKYIDDMLIDIAVIGYDSIAWTTDKYLNQMSADIAQFTAENSDRLAAMEKSISEYAVTAEEVTKQSFIDQLDALPDGASFSDIFDSFGIAAKETFGILKASATGQLEITNEAKRFYGQNIEMLDSKRVTLDLKKSVKESELLNNLGNIGIDTSELTLDAIGMTSLGQQLNDLMQSPDDMRMLGEMSNAVEQLSMLNDINSSIESNNAEMLDVAKSSDELLNRIQKEFEEEYGAPQRQREFMRQNLTFLRNLAHSMNRQTGGVFTTETGLINRISEAEFAALKAIDAGQEIATTFEQFDEMFGEKLADSGPREVSSYTKVRPITNNINIEINNDFLEATQLDVNQVNELALTIRDELVRIGFLNGNDGSI